MPLSLDWKPSDLASFDKEWDQVKLPADGEISPADARVLMVKFEHLASELGDLVANGLYYEEQCKFKLDSAQALAYLRAEGKSDKAKETVAKNATEVKVAFVKVIEAKATRRLLEHRLDSAVRSVHICKTLVKTDNEEKWL